MSAIGRYSVLNILLFRYRISLVSAGRTQGVNGPIKRETKVATSPTPHSPTANTGLTTVNTTVL